MGFPIIEDICVFGDNYPIPEWQNGIGLSTNLGNILAPELTCAGCPQRIESNNKTVCRVAQI